MSHVLIKTLNFNSAIVEKLTKLNIYSCKDFFQYSKFELVNMLGISGKDVENMTQAISQFIAPKPITGLEMYIKKKESPNNGFLSTSFFVLDNLLQGGLPLGNITEIVGPPSVGKTQFCILLSILTTIPTSMGGLDGSVIYIDTESAFTAKRLKEMAKAKFPEMFADQNKLVRVMQRIQVYRPMSLTESRKILKQIEYDVLRKQVKLIIIDSMVSMLNRDLGCTDITSSIIERNAMFSEQSAILKNIAKTFQVIVFVTNQITTQIKAISPTNSKPIEDIDFNSLFLEQNSHNSRFQKHVENKSRVIPSLGTSWTHCVNIRFVARFMNSNVRELIIWKSPMAPNVAMNYIITEAGIEMNSNVKEMKHFDREEFNIFTKCDYLSPEKTFY